MDFYIQRVFVTPTALENITYQSHHTLKRTILGSQNETYV